MTRIASALLAATVLLLGVDRARVGGDRTAGDH